MLTGLIIRVSYEMSSKIVKGYNSALVTIYGMPLESNLYLKFICRWPRFLIYRCAKPSQQTLIDYKTLLA